MITKPKDTAELIKALEKLSKRDDTKGAHIRADELLLDFIDDPAVQRAFCLIDKWYA